MSHGTLGRRILAGCVLGSTAGCLPVPHTHVRQPAATFRVEDASGAPLAGARLTLFAGFAVGHAVQDSVVVITNAQGIARVRRERERHLWMVLMPDAEAPWRWAYCVSVAGHGAQAGFLTEEPRDTVQVRLPGRDASSGCPGAPRTLYDVARPK